LQDPLETPPEIKKLEISRHLSAKIKAAGTSQEQKFRYSIFGQMKVRFRAGARSFALCDSCELPPSLLLLPHSEPPHRVLRLRSAHDVQPLTFRAFALQEHLQTIVLSSHSLTHLLSRFCAVLLRTTQHAMRMFEPQHFRLTWIRPAIEFVQVPAAS
jgi:hypothetical protein